MEVTMPKPSSQSNPSTQRGKAVRHPRSWPEVQLPHVAGTVSYEQAVAAVRAVKERRTLGNPA
ncbi:MAG TPA: hypothetical protein VGX50_16550 [Longimicrobium sp.]|jgi:hypothetical protein|nr:hypothetical protein [Longimicrobium sp.]